MSSPPQLHTFGTHAFVGFREAAGGGAVSVGWTLAAGAVLWCVQFMRGAYFRRVMSKKARVARCVVCDVHPVDPTVCGGTLCTQCPAPGAGGPTEPEVLAAIAAGYAAGTATVADVAAFHRAVHSPECGLFAPGVRVVTSGLTSGAHNGRAGTVVVKDMDVFGRVPVRMDGPPAAVLSVMYNRLERLDAVSSFAQQSAAVAQLAKVLGRRPTAVEVDRMVKCVVR
jgi:hypothetical protein